MYNRSVPVPPWLPRSGSGGWQVAGLAEGGSGDGMVNNGSDGFFFTTIFYRF